MSKYEQNKTKIEQKQNYYTRLSIIKAGFQTIISR